MTQVARGKLILTYQDYLQMPDDRTRKEILGGDLYVTPAPSPAHQRALTWLLSSIHTYLVAHRSGRIYPAPIDVILSQVDVVQPDLVFVRADRLSIITDAGVQGPPDLVIEILSPSTMKLDRGRKMEVYARAGIPEYWIIDLDTRAAEIYRLEGDVYGLTLRVPETDALRSDQFPGLAIQSSSIWD